MYEGYTNEELALLYQYGTLDTGDVLWENLMGFTVKWLDKKIKNTSYDKNELLSIAHVAFTKTLNNIDPKKGKFTTLYGRILNNEYVRHIIEDNKVKDAYNYSYFYDFSDALEDSNGNFNNHIQHKNLIVQDDLSFLNLDNENLKRSIEDGLEYVPEFCREILLKRLFEEEKTPFEEIAKQMEVNKGIKRSRSLYSFHYNVILKTARENYQRYTKQKHIA